jgi:uncharacterized protein (DUF1800 family)
MDAVLRALNRFGLGARVGERKTLSDPRNWLRAQLRGGAPTLAPPEGITPDGIGEAARSLRDLARDDGEARRQARRRLLELGASEQRHALTARVTSERPFVERLVAFWSNHLCISVSKIVAAPMAGSYERDAIRPHVLGRFEDLVLASARHPAMLAYLDNIQSIGPNSQGAQLVQRFGGGARRGSQGGRGGPATQQPAPRRGLNENYARELMELHTLGVNGGYTQQDVQELARMLTGWSVEGLGGRQFAQQMATRQGGADRLGGGRFGRRGRPGAAASSAPADDGPIRFVFRDLLHEPGSKTLLGAKYGEAGVEEGERAIKALCAHPSTAQFIARKLVTHFVSDDPSEAAVTRLAGVFRSTHGDLRAMAEALIDLPDAWQDDRRKFRTPQDWMIAVHRALGATTVRENVGPLLRQLRQPFWGPSAPKGYGDTVQEWADPDSLLNRGELSRTIARLPMLREIDPRALADVVDVPAGSPLMTMLADTSIARDERVALALAGPAFQWR